MICACGQLDAMSVFWMQSEGHIMVRQKTTATDARVDEFIRARGSESQQKDCEMLISLFEKLTEEKPRMWGPSIVGFGAYTYRYESVRTGESCLTGFSIRGKKLVVYLIAEGNEQERLLAELGKHTMGKACLYFAQLSDLKLKVLEELVRNSLGVLRARYPASDHQ